MKVPESQLSGYVLGSLCVCQKEWREKRGVNALVDAVSRRCDGIAVKVHRNAAVEHLHHAVLKTRCNSQLLRLHLKCPLDLLQARIPLSAVIIILLNYRNAIEFQQSSKSGDDDRG